MVGRQTLDRPPKGLLKHPPPSCPCPCQEKELMFLLSLQGKKVHLRNRPFLCDLAENFLILVQLPFWVYSQDEQEGFFPQIRISSAVSIRRCNLVPLLVDIEH